MDGSISPCHTPIGNTHCTTTSVHYTLANHWIYLGIKNKLQTSKTDCAHVWFSSKAKGNESWTKKVKQQKRQFKQGFLYLTVRQVSQWQPSCSQSSCTLKTSGTASWLQQPLSLWGRWTSQSCWVVGTLRRSQCLQLWRLWSKVTDGQRGSCASSQSGCTCGCNAGSHVW